MTSCQAGSISLGYSGCSLGYSPYPPPILSNSQVFVSFPLGLLDILWLAPLFHTWSLLEFGCSVDWVLAHSHLQHSQLPHSFSYPLSLSVILPKFAVSWRLSIFSFLLIPHLSVLALYIYCSTGLVGMTRLSNTHMVPLVWIQQTAYNNKKCTIGLHCHLRLKMSRITPKPHLIKCLCSQCEGMAPIDFLVFILFMPS